MASAVWGERGCAMSVDGTILYFMRTVQVGSEWQSSGEVASTGLSSFSMQKCSSKPSAKEVRGLLHAAAPRSSCTEPFAQAQVEGWSLAFTDLIMG